MTRTHSLTGLAIVCLIGLGTLAGAQTFPAGTSLAAAYDSATLNLPTPLGGLEITPDGATLLVGTGANTANGEVRAVPIFRNPITNQITGLGTATVLTAAPFIDGGLQYGPGGTLFWTTFSNHQLGQLPSGGGPFVQFPLTPTGVPPSTGSLEFVPAGLPNAGDLLIASFSAGDIFTVTLTDNGDGTYTPDAGSATLFAALPSSTEGIRHIPSGPGAGSMAIVNFGVGGIGILAIDPATGLPVLSGGSPVVGPYISGIGGAEGLVFDPLTNDFFVSQFSGASQILQITGFPASPTLGACGVGNVAIGAGGALDVLTVNASAGGIPRRVEVPLNSPVSLSVAQPPGTIAPAAFAVYGCIGAPDGSSGVTLPIGSFCFTPNDLVPFYPGTFVLTSNFLAAHPNQLVASTPAPWTATLSGGLPFPARFSFQGVIDDLTAPSGYAVTNAVILDIH